MAPRSVRSARLRGWLDLVRQIAGMPDYERYAEHLRRCHPDRPVPDRRTFFEEYLRTRYGAGSTRCC